MLFVCVCVGVTGIPIVVPPSTLHMDGDRLWLVVVVVAALINQLPAAGSEPVADTNKWQKWGGRFLRKHYRRAGVVEWVGQTVGNTQMGPCGWLEGLRRRWRWRVRDK